MTLHSFRRRSRPPDWDATTITFAGASGPAPAPVTMTRAAPRPHVTPLDAPAAPEPPRAQRPYDEAIFVLIPSGFGLLCGMDLWRRHADPEAAHYRDQFDALRISALRAGWHPDAYGRWCCPRCQDDPFYATPKPLAHWHPGVPHARPRPETTPFSSAECWLLRVATDYHADAAAAFADGDPAAEFWFQVEAELDALTRTAQAAVHGRHEAGAR